MVYPSVNSEYSRGENYFLFKLLEMAIELKATDVHLNCGCKPKFRINKELSDVDYEELDEEMISGIVGALLSKDSQSFLTFQQDRSVDFSFSIETVGNFRVNVFKERGRDAVAIRILSPTIPKFESLNLSNSIKEVTKARQGLFIFSGATGSGKTTAMASLLETINNNRSLHIITIEDPIEYIFESKKCLISQREIGKDTDNFENALRVSLREDPDVIMFGEMRDAKAISVALQAAETGHLVLSTLHTTGAISAVERIVNSFSSDVQSLIRDQLAGVLGGVVSMSLLPKKDGTGLVPACEIMFSNSAISNLIREGKSYQIISIIQAGKESGMVLLENDLARLIKDDIITEETGMLYSNDKKLLRSLI